MTSNQNNERDPLKVFTPDDITLEEWMEKKIQEGYPEIVITLLKTLPKNLQAKYRGIWLRIMKEKKE